MCANKMLWNLHVYGRNSKFAICVDRTTLMTCYHQTDHPKSKLNTELLYMFSCTCLQSNQGKCGSSVWTEIIEM